ncbi:MAG: DUF4339 domain-containing protein, partial [Pseudomonadota bacterium]
MATDLWWYSVDGERKGPIPSTELIELVRQGSISPDALVWREGQEEWRTMSTSAIAGLAPELFVKPPPIPTPPPISPSAEASRNQQSDGGVTQVQPLGVWQFTTIRLCVFGLIALNVFLIRLSLEIEDSLRSASKTIGTGMYDNSIRSVQADEELLLFLSVPALVLLLVTLFLYFYWLVRVARIARSVDPQKMDMSTASLVWGHFIPLIWFIVPPRGVSKILQVAQSKLVKSNPQEKTNTVYVWPWWTLNWLPLVTIVASIHSSSLFEQNITSSDLDVLESALNSGADSYFFDAVG